MARESIVIAFAAEIWLLLACVFYFYYLVNLHRMLYSLSVHK
jgi:hypothetical protein